MQSLHVYPSYEQIVRLLTLSAHPFKRFQNIHQLASTLYKYVTYRVKNCFIQVYFLLGTYIKWTFLVYFIIYMLVKMTVCFPRCFLKSVNKDLRPSTQGSKEISTFGVTIAFLKKPRTQLLWKIKTWKQRKLESLTIISFGHWFQDRTW